MPGTRPAAPARLQLPHEVARASAGPDTFGTALDGRQSFGVVRIDGATRVMHVTFVDAQDGDLHAFAVAAETRHALTTSPR